MPTIFTLIDLQCKDFFYDRRTEEISSELPPGRVVYGEKWVESSPIQFSGVDHTCYIKGKFDTAIQFDDGSYGIIDFKTINPKDKHIPLYSRQLHAYAYALENAAPYKFKLHPIRVIGLVCVEPKQILKLNSNGFLANRLEVSWINIPRDDGAFKQFLREVVQLLSQPSPPLHNGECIWCEYRDRPENILEKIEEERLTKEDVEVLLGDLYSYYPKEFEDSGFTPTPEPDWEWDF
jgi:hypothetical protein